MMRYDKEDTFVSVPAHILRQTEEGDAFIVECILHHQDSKKASNVYDVPEDLDFRYKQIRLTFGQISETNVALKIEVVYPENYSL